MVAIRQMNQFIKEALENKIAYIENFDTRDIIAYFIATYNTVLSDDLLMIVTNSGHRFFLYSGIDQKLILENDMNYSPKKVTSDTKCEQEESKKPNIEEKKERNTHNEYRETTAERDHRERMGFGRGWR